ncbi:MAG: hypothetical protein AAF065_12075 [Verrucomicrobiota bacterium]
MSFEADILRWVRDLGVLLSVTAATGAYVYRTRVEQRRMANRVLYYLLEFRHCIRLKNVKFKGFGKEGLQSYLSVWQKYGVRLDSNDLEVVSGVEALIDQMIGDMLARKATLPEGFIAGFRSALDDLSERDPVVAFRINGSEDIDTLLTVLSEYNERAQKLVSEDDLAQFFLDKVQEEVEVDQLQKPLEDLDDAIRSLAVKCGVYTRFRVWKILRRQEPKLPSSIRKELDELMEEMVPKLIRVIEKTATQGQVNLEDTGASEVGKCVNGDSR